MSLPRVDGVGRPKFDFHTGEDNLDGLIKALDVDGDGIIDMDEWIAQLDKIPLLKAQLDQYIDPATGLINTELTGPMKPPTAEATIPPADAPAEEAAAAPAE